MAFATLSCPACGAKEIVREDGRYACAFCKAGVLPRLQERLGISDRLTEALTRRKGEENRA